MLYLAFASSVRYYLVVDTMKFMFTDIILSDQCISLPCFVVILYFLVLKVRVHCIRRGQMRLLDVVGSCWNTFICLLRRWISCLPVSRKPWLCGRRTETVGYLLWRYLVHPVLCPFVLWWFPANFVLWSCSISMGYRSKWWDLLLLLQLSLLTWRCLSRWTLKWVPSITCFSIFLCSHRSRWGSNEVVG